MHLFLFCVSFTIHNNTVKTRKEKKKLMTKLFSVKFLFEKVKEEEIFIFFEHLFLHPANLIGKFILQQITLSIKKV